jgi:hypothetical protein
MGRANRADRIKIAYRGGNATGRSRGTSAPFSGEPV